MSDKEEAFVFLHEVEQMGRLNRLPYLIICHCPDTGEWVRASSSLKNNGEAITAFEHVAKDYMDKLRGQLPEGE